MLKKHVFFLIMPFVADHCHFKALQEALYALIGQLLQACVGTTHHVS